MVVISIVWIKYQKTIVDFKIGLFNVFVYTGLVTLLIELDSFKITR